MPNVKAAKQAKTVSMISLRDVSVPSLTGHIVRFEAGVARDVPVHMVDEAMKLGCAPTDSVNLPSDSELGRKAVDFVGTLRDSLLFLACKTVAEKNDSADFSGTTPKGEVLGEITGFRVTAKEATAAFQVYMAAHKSGETPELHPSADKILMVQQASTKAELVELAELFEFPKEEWTSKTKSELHEYLLATLREG